MIRFQASQVTIDAAADDQPARSITGIAVPWNVTAGVSTGQQVRFAAGALPTDGRAPMLINGHDLSSIDNIVGIVSERVATDDGMMFTAKYADEATLFRLAGQLEKEAPWAARRPPVWG